MYIFNAKIGEVDQLEKMLIGRKDTVDWLEEQTLKLAKTKESYYTLLIGSRGSGKTHILKVLYSRVIGKKQVDKNVAIAYMSEDEYGIDNYLDLLVRIFQAFIRRAENAEQKQILLEKIEQLKKTSPEYRDSYAEQYLLEFLNGRQLLILIENLNDIFKGMKQNGQSKLRDFIQKHNQISILASSQAIFSDVNQKDKPFFNFFHVIHLKKLTFEEALELIRVIARIEERQELLDYLDTKKGKGNIQALYQLTEGNHRLLVTFYNFLKAEFKSELSKSFLQTIDKLKPYYESFLKLLPPQQQKIVQYLALQRTPQPGKSIAENCFLASTTLSKQMSDLQRLGYVEGYKEGRDKYYEIQEPLLRICIEVNENKEGIIKLFVDFLGNLYGLWDLKHNFLRFKYLQDFADSEKQRIYREESRYYRSALKSYGGNWQPKPEQEARILSFQEPDKREEYLRKVAGLDLDKLEAAVENKQWKEAEKYLLDCLDADIENHVIWNSLGVIYSDQCDYKKSEGSFKKALIYSPEYAKAWYNLGVIYSNQGDYKKSEESYKKALVYSPEDAEAWYSLGNSYYAQGNYKKSEESYKKALFYSPEDAIVWYNLGNLYYAQDKYEQSKESYKKALVYAPEYASAWYNLGGVYEDQGNYKKSEESYKKALVYSPEDSDTWYNLGCIYEDQGNYKKSEDSYKKALVYSPEDSDTWYNLGGVYEDQGNYKKSEESYKKALIYSPEDASTWYNLGLLYFDHFKQIKKARNAFDKYIEYNENAIGKYSRTQYIATIFEELQLSIDNIGAIQNRFKEEDRQNIYQSVLTNLLAYGSQKFLLQSLRSKAFVSVLEQQEDLPTLWLEVLRGSIQFNGGEKNQLPQLKIIQSVFTQLYSDQANFTYLLKFLDLAIRYYEGEKKVLYELTKEEREVFLQWLQIEMPEK